MADNSMNLPNLTHDPACLDARITLALGTSPVLEIPEGFAARVAAKLPATASMNMAPRRHGRRAAIVCLAILLALIFLFACGPAMSPVWISIESIFCIQFALIAVCLAVRNLACCFDWLS
jgi:hypothetical protein